MKKTTKQEIKSIDEFNQHLSLWNIITGGKQYGQIFLQKLIDQIQTDKFCNPTFKYPSILITGKTGKKTIANAFLRSLCLSTKLIPALYFTTASSAPQFFTDSRDAGYIISDVEQLNIPVQNIIYTILKYQKYILYNYLSEVEENYEVGGIIILTAKDIKKVGSPILESVTHTVQLEPHNNQQLELIILQILKFTNQPFEKDEIVKKIVEYGSGEIKKCIKLLKNSIVVMRSGSKEKLMMKDVEMAGRLGKTS
jgi:hypothetical protein